MSALLHYSYILFSVVLLTVLAAFALVSADGTVLGLITLVVGAALVIFWVTARRGGLTPVNPEKRIRRGRSSERPVVVHFYSDWDLVSLVKRVLVANTEKVHRGHFDFIYIDMNHREGPATAEALKAGLGDFVLYDTAGNLVEKTGLISAAKLEKVLKRPVH